MPQADLSYSAKIALDPAKILRTVEEVVSAHDAKAGACKGRAHPLEITHHDHVLLRLRMLNKPHRDDAFMTALVAALQTALRDMVPAPSILGIEIGFLEQHYASLTIP
ncbi:hypothetical protein [Sulfitobacter guttiformis]|uniref:5-carboxymethyl-2-hydroxymuconate isomerase n=1 Tax=Sulfitobacter guttiformis TaxID=74349 RepID=A0A420DR32_9RHOB|nr:hypothetical protein [Sulfitobacter guttiformis]KIN74018.1 hypothetical protein Z949_3213 [Sulfitobacter guttiformis KCTC 32187]RKE96640.1 hypothetical protein C8N30_1206 [Sulfitobacter guttiformis]